MAPFIVSSFGLFVMGLFQGLFTAPSWQSFPAVDLWVGLDHRAPHHHHLSVAHGGGQRQALLALLCVSGRRAVHRALAALGADHPWGGPVGARRGAES